MNNYSHSDFDELLKDEENQKCFDCGKLPAQWASVNNSIYLCLNCAGVHRGFGVSISYIRSITMDSWNENQLKMMRLGGNKRLKDLLSVFSCDPKLSSENIFNSNLLDFYRKLLKSEVSDGKQPPMPQPEEAFSKFVDLTTNNNKNNMINRFQAVGKDFEERSFNAWMGTAYNNTKNFAYNVKDKVSEMDLGNKIKNAGYITYEVVKDTGTKVVNKGTEAAKSSTVQNMAKKANDGVNYIFGKLFGNTKKDETNIQETMLDEYNRNVNNKSPNKTQNKENMK